MKEFFENTIIATWVAPIITGVIVVILTTIVGKIVSIWWKNRTFIRKVESANEKYINNILPYMIQKMEIDINILLSIKSAIAKEYQVAEKYLYTNEQIRDQIILSISDTRFMTEIHKLELIQNVLEVFNNIGNAIECAEDEINIKRRKISKKYPLIALIVAMIFTLIVYAINPEEFNNPNSLAQALGIIGILTSLLNATMLWLLILDDTSTRISVGITDFGLFGITFNVVEALNSTIFEILFGKRKKISLIVKKKRNEND